MHFWIDKRSQTCGFGRARVAASLSGSTGVGLGFGHPPRRMVGKSLVTPSIHRMQAASSDCNRPHVQNNNNNNNHNNNSNNNGSINNTTTHNNNSNNNNVNRTHRNRSNNNNGGSGGGGVVRVGGILNNINAAQIHNENNGNHYHHLSTSNNGTGFISRHHQQNSVVENVNNQNLQRSPLASVNNQDYSIPVSLPHIYGGPSHTQELEQGSLGLGPITARPNLSAGTIGGTVSANIAMVDTSDSQLLPSHLKCGMWASLVLASVFVAGAKFYFDHQGTGLEVLIFCAFSATFFLAACTVSLCRLPRDLATSPSPSVDGHNRALDGHHIITSHNNYTHHQSNQQQHHQLYATNSGEILEVPITHHQQYNNSMASSHITTTTSAPPPPYHIAILLPENSKDLQLDETPPPSYDKIII